VLFANKKPRLENRTVHDGIIIIDKEPDMTSHDVVARCRRILGTKKVGHTGTLDPFATGVMVILVGKATRIAQFLDKDEKEYEAVIRFGHFTDTGDLTGEKIGDEMNLEFSDDAFDAVLESFIGESSQIPPMYSAKKIDGKKLYELARAGKEVERDAVSIKISSISRIESRKDEFTIRVACSAGTYIRVLAEDIAKKLGSAAHLTALRRIRAGNFDLKNALTLEQLKDSDVAMTTIPISEALSHLKAIVVPDIRIKPTLNGMSSRVSVESYEDGQTVKIVTESGELLAIGNIDFTEKSVRPKIVLS
jgi:tRNA pseudouridine55 synthase